MAQSTVSQRDWDDAHLINAARDIHADDPAFGYRFIADELPGRGIKDVYSNRIVGYSMDSRIEVHARGRRPRPRRGIALTVATIVHTDRAVNFGQPKFVHTLSRNGGLGLAAESSAPCALPPSEESSVHMGELIAKVSPISIPVPGLENATSSFNNASNATTRLWTFGRQATSLGLPQFRTHALRRPFNALIVAWNGSIKCSSDSPRRMSSHGVPVVANDAPRIELHAQVNAISSFTPFYHSIADASRRLAFSMACEDKPTRCSQFHAGIQ